MSIRAAVFIIHEVLMSHGRPHQPNAFEYPHEERIAYADAQKR